MSVSIMTLEQARKDAGLTQQNMADELGVSRPTYAKIEANPDTATVLQAKRICEVLSRPYERIFFRRDAS